VSTPFWLVKALVRTGIARWLPPVRCRLDGGAAYLRYLGDRCLATPLDDLAGLAAFWQAESPDAIDLALSAPRLDVAPSAVPRTAAGRGYPPPGGLPELRAAVADRLHERGLAVSPVDEVLVTAGAAGAFFAALDTFVNPGDKVVLFDPTSPLFRLGLLHRRARVRRVPVTAEDGRVRFGMEPFTKALPAAKLLVLADPATPTGGVFAPEDLEQIAWWANKYDVLIYVDESFERFRYEGDPTCLGALAAAKRRALMAGGVSKGHGLAAARVGWLAGYRHLIRPCAATAALSAPFVATAGQQAALAALRAGEAAFAPVREEFAAKRRYAYERLRGLGLEPAWPAGGFFLWLPVAPLGLSGRAFAERLLAEKRVLVTPGELYGPGGAGHVRVSYAADDGRLREGLCRLAEFVTELRKPAAPPVAEPVPEPAAEEPVPVG
jgi:aspartate/methionine/tyrosine aminotransferase